MVTKYHITLLGTTLIGIHTESAIASYIRTYALIKN